MTQLTTRQAIMALLKTRRVYNVATAQDVAQFKKRGSESAVDDAASIGTLCGG